MRWNRGTTETVSNREHVLAAEADPESSVDTTRMADMSNVELADHLEAFRDYGNPSWLNEVLGEAAQRLRNAQTREEIRDE